MSKTTSMQRRPGILKKLSHRAPMQVSRCSLLLVGNSSTPHLCPRPHLRQFPFTLDLPQGFPKVIDQNVSPIPCTQQSNCEEGHWQRCCLRYSSPKASRRLYACENYSRGTESCRLDRACIRVWYCRFPQLRGEWKRRESGS
jgi:hypothetical protein